MAQPKKFWRRIFRAFLLLLICAVVGGGTRWFFHVRSPEYQWLQAGKAIERRDWSTAEIYLKNLIAAKPENVDARLSLAAVYLQSAAQARKQGSKSNAASDSQSASGDPARSTVEIDPPLAVEQLVEVARLRPTDADVRARLLATYYVRGQHKAALQMARELVELGKASPGAISLCLEAALENENWKEAESLYKKLGGDSDGWSPERALYALYLYERRGNNKKLPPILTRSVREITAISQADLDSLDERQIRMLGVLLSGSVRWASDGAAATGELAGCMGILERFAKTPFGKANRGTLVNMAIDWMSLAKPAPPPHQNKRQAVRERFLQFAEPVVAANGASPQATAVFHVASATRALAQGKPQEAFYLYAKALQFKGALELVREEFLQSVEEALRSIGPGALGPPVESLLQKFPQEPALLLVSTEFALRRNDFPTASRRIEALAKCDTDTARIAYMRSRLLAATGKTSEALVKVLDILQSRPDYRAAQFLAAQLVDMHGDHAGALERLDALDGSNGDEFYPSHLRAQILTQLGRKNEAATLLTRLTQRFPFTPESWLALVAFQGSQAQGDAAIATLRKGLARLPGEPDLQNILLELLLLRRQVDDAVITARELAEQTRDPAFPLRAAGLFLKAGLRTPGGEWLRLARQQTAQPSDDLLFLEALATSLRAEGEKRHDLLQEARTRYLDVLRRNPNHIGAMNNLAWLLLRNFNEPAEALAMVTELRKAQPINRMTPEMLDTVLEVYRRSGRRAEAQQILTASLSRFPESGLLALHQGALLMVEAVNDPQKLRLARRQLELARQRGLSPERLRDVDSMLAQIK